ncbi:MAG: lipoprotein insertase outer membrane protein LolB [Desulfobacteraceae bacterium]
MAVMIAGMIMLAGCGHIFKPPPDDAHARMLLERLLQNNPTLTQYKGLAGVQMQLNGRSQSSRIAFAAVQPNKMRVEILNMMGTPLVSLTGNGENVTLFSHGRRKYYRFRQTRSALFSLIEVPIGIEDLQNLLAGRVPVPPYVSVQSLTEHPSTPDNVLILTNRWNGIVARLQLDPSNHGVKALKVLDADGELQYRIQWLKWREIGGYRVPSKLVIESTNTQQVTLTLDRFWPNANVSPSTFELEPSLKNKS